jgi:hypothetical protein
LNRRDRGERREDKPNVATPFFTLHKNEIGSDFGANSIN